MKTSVALMVLLLGCSSAQRPEASIPAEGRPLWEQCSRAMNDWCHQQSQGDLSLDRDCEANTARAYAALRDDASRRQYVAAHHCSL